MFQPFNKTSESTESPEMPFWVAGVIWSLLFSATSLILLSLFI